MNTETKATLIEIKGRVQGVGMRPFIYRLAIDNGLCGFVYNRPDGVVVHIEGTVEAIVDFQYGIEEYAPQAANIKHIICQPAEFKNYTGFKILHSRESEGLITEICPDIAICPDCLAELQSSERRTQYPFINCTNCGPRFTLVNDFPYDRVHTTMHEFEMCPDCRKEYNTSEDRRFHAQPTSCRNCGPVYNYIKGSLMLAKSDKVIQKSAGDINEGKVIAVKGLGGYNLACDAYNHQSVTELRNFKNREKKPFAVMFQSVEDIKALAIVNKKEEETLLSWHRPIVVLQLRQNRPFTKIFHRSFFKIQFRTKDSENNPTYRTGQATKNEDYKNPDKNLFRALGQFFGHRVNYYHLRIKHIFRNIHYQKLASGITSGLNTIGAFLPYLPLHYLLFNKLQTNAIVLTSGNESDIPIIIDDGTALEVFKRISGGILTNNRKIAHRADDSVVRVICSEPQLMRRARGYVPSPVDLNFNTDGILATGAELSNCFCIGKGRQAILSQHIGDLKNAETYSFFSENIKEFGRLYRFKPRRIACDLHPDYLSTQFARESGLPMIKVQHHHAHIAACMAEYNINEPVIGISYDGTGYGTDGRIWGSEAIIANLADFKRIGHFEYVPLPGGDLATKETWRSALAYLYKAFGPHWYKPDIPFLKEIDIFKAKKLIDAMDKGINSPLCCSAGRLFDAVAAILGICTESNYHAEAPLLLENYLDRSFKGTYSFLGDKEISFLPAIKEIIKDSSKKKPVEQIVTVFHNTIAAAAATQVKYALKTSTVKKIVIGGGTFQNKYLTEKFVHLLESLELEIYISNEVPCNDGGIALGQLAIAANKTGK